MKLSIFLVCLLGFFSLEHFAFCMLYSNDFAVKLAVDQINATEVAKTHGFYVNSKLGHLNVYHFIHPDVPVKSAFSAANYVDKLRADPRVKQVFQQEHLVRWKRNRPVIYDKQQEIKHVPITDNSVYQRIVVPRLQTKHVTTDDNIHIKFDDPYFVDQWYLNNVGQTGGRAGLDLNVDPAWKKNFTGSGIVICILDDGIDHTHPDLVDNFDAAASIDFTGEEVDFDPMPDISNPNNVHGTLCAGAVVAKANNSVCGVGVAYEANIGGIRMLDGTITDLLESKALFFKPHYVSIYSASWGPIDDGETMEAPRQFARAALKEGVEKGRDGLGVIYVWATGNGGLTFDDCNADGYVSSIETLAVGSVSNEGKLPYFMESCTSTMVVVPTGGQRERPAENTQNRRIKVVTTGLHGQCVENFEGTSGAPPLASGCIALALQANPGLTWRDVQHLVVHSARIPSSDYLWIRNGAGLHVSRSLGFGLMDCAKMVEFAQHWRNMPPQRKCIYTSEQMNKTVSFSKPIKIQIFCNSCTNMPSSHLTHLEHVQVYINLKHPSRGDIQIILISPAGTKSELLSPRKFDRLKDINFYFMTVHNWSENPYGIWTLEIHDKKNNKRDGILLQWSLILYGYKMTRQQKNLKSREMTLREIDAVMKDEFSRHVHIKKYENPLFKKKLPMSKIVDLSQDIKSAKNFSFTLASQLALSLTENELKEMPRSLAEDGEAPLMFMLSEKVIKLQHKSKLGEEFHPRLKSIAPSLLELIANGYSLNRKLVGNSLQKMKSFETKKPISSNILGKPLMAKFESADAKDNEFKSEFSALKELLILVNSTVNNSKSLDKEYSESNLPEKNIDSLSESADQFSFSNKYPSKENSFENIYPFSHDIFAERMFFSRIDLRNKQFTTNKIPSYTLAPIDVERTRIKHNIFRNLLQNLRFYFLNYKKDFGHNHSVKRKEYLQNSFSAESFDADKKTETLNGISFEKIEEPILKTTPPEKLEELEDELNSAKENKELMDKFKLYPRSVKNKVN